VTLREKPKSGWKLFVHTAFSEKLDALVAEVERLRTADRKGYKQHPKTKLLKRIVDLIEVEIPRDPGASKYALGSTLGPEYRHWRRAKFLGRFRLFFRYSSKDRVIIYAWINDQNTLRKAGGRNDPYTIFNSLLRKGRPPDGWDALIREAATLKQRAEGQLI
jgi:toxin YhaV